MSRIRTVGETLERAIEADGDDGNRYTVEVYRLIQEVELSGAWEPISNPPKRLRLPDGQQVFASSKGKGLYTISKTGITLTPL